MAEQINSPKIGTVVRHTGWRFEDDKNYPCDVLITDGEYMSDGRLSNFWYWQRVLPDGSLAKTEHGYGSFEKSDKNYYTKSETKQRRRTMKARDLRIGNWVQFRHTETPVLITLGDFVREYKEEHLEDYEPIPLTEEWLKRFGFSVRKSLGFEAYDLDDTYTIYYNTKATPYGFELSFGVDFEIEIKHVHQLQNLYFALTGEELTIKE